MCYGLTHISLSDNSNQLDKAAKTKKERSGKGKTLGWTSPYDKERGYTGNYCIKQPKLSRPVALQNVNKCEI